MRRLAAGLFLTLAACGSDAPEEDASVRVPVPATPAPVPTQAPAMPDAPGALPAPELDAAPSVAGSWRLSASASGSEALFAGEGEAPIFGMRCEPQARAVVLVRHGVAGASLRLVTQSAAATYPAEPAGAATRARVAADDSFLSALAAERGPIAVLVDENAALALPGDPRIARVVEGCRAARG